MCQYFLWCSQEDLIVLFFSYYKTELLLVLCQSGFSVYLFEPSSLRAFSKHASSVNGEFIILLILGLLDRPFIITLTSLIEKTTFWVQKLPLLLHYPCQNGPKATQPTQAAVTEALQNRKKHNLVPIRK